MSERILDDYVRITHIINNIQNRIDKYKERMIRKIEGAKTIKDQNILLEEFRKIIDGIKRDPIITEKYKLLKKKQLILKKQLLHDHENTSTSDDIENNLNQLYTKYLASSNNEKNIVRGNCRKQSNNKHTSQDEKIKFILNEIEKNLENYDDA
jgi:hypothetical protein